MGDIITFLEFLQKLEQGGLIPTEQMEYLEDILENTLRKSLSNGVYDSLEELLENQLNGNEQNHLFINILKTTPKPKEKDTLTKLTEYLDSIFKDKPKDFKYSLDFSVFSQDKKYIEIFKDPDQGYTLKYANISDSLRYIYTTPLKDINKIYLDSIWAAIEEDEDNWKEIKEGIKEEMANK